MYSTHSAATFWAMPDQAMLNHAAQVLASISADERADTALRFYFESHRYLQPPAKRVISHTVFVYFRWLSWLDPKASPQKRLEQAVALHERFTADPKSIKAETLAVRAVPAWLWDELSFSASPGAPARLPADSSAELSADSSGDLSADLSAEGLAKVEGFAKAEASAPADVSAAAESHLPAVAPDTTGTAAKGNYLRQLQRDPALWLRARPGQSTALAKSLFACAPPDLSRLSTLSAQLPLDALLFTGTQDLFKTEQFKTGEFEIQDLASQLVGIAAAPKSGETWWDACAGEGGKTLHLADLMANKGLIWSTDRNARRLDTLKRRAARAKLFNYRTALWDGSAKLPTKTKFDGILVDAPCSGVGTWQRNPHARWTTTLNDVRELAAKQLALLNHVAGSLKPRGRLIYAVCTLTRSETTAVAEAFTAAHPELEPVSPENREQKTEDRETQVRPSSDLPPSPSLRRTGRPPSSVFLWPHELNANGMFIAAWRRR